MPEWRERARELGLDPERLSVPGKRLPPLELDRRVEQSIVDWMAGSDGLTQRRSTLTPRDVIQAVCERLPAGVRANVADIERAADRFLASRSHASAVPSCTNLPRRAALGPCGSDRAVDLAAVGQPVLGAPDGAAAALVAVNVSRDRRHLGT